MHEAENVAASPLRFEVDGMEVHRTIEAIEDAGGELGAIYHSHTRSEPYPSQTDINFAAGWPGVEWLIVGLSRDGDPEVRSFRIDDGRVTEVAVEVMADAARGPLVCPRCATHPRRRASASAPTAACR